MAWTDPRSWSAGEVVTSSQMNTHVRDNLQHLRDQKVEVIAHGGTAATARPSEVDVAMWVGTVDPSNAANDDLLLRTDRERTYLRAGGSWRPLGFDGSVEDDLSDITTHTVEQTGTTSVTLLDIASGPGVLLGGLMQGYTTGGTINLSIDGTGNTLSSVDAEDDAGNVIELIYLPMLYWQSSLTVEGTTNTGTTRFSGYAFTRLL